MADEKTLHLARVRIDGLLDESRDPVDLSLSQDEPTIITGSNGTGKSTILRMLEAVGTADWPTLSTLPFKTLRLKFDRLKQLRIDRDADSDLSFIHGQKRWTWSKSASSAYPDYMYKAT